ncbi:YezD family protein [Sphingobium sp. HBC34]|uniref:YezD family protein n=1 Tax=Sphingobium cyanobacteriorum TaxID=3063954 RepID=A0ABT8ZHZ4_9SPHN|nr:YezD family protein [Sphingobium sp. HBC34]MDO7833958.1 YezD family protein [Sphingobium sp. HBC34]
MSEHKAIDIRHVRADGQRPDIAASIDKVRGVLEGLRFGSITLTVHDARVVQIDVTEKTRLTS